MKKIIITLALLFALTAGAFGQNVTLSSNSELNRYATFFAERQPTRPGTINLPTRYLMPIRNEEIFAQAATLGGNEVIVDTVLEFAIVSYYSTMIDIRPAQADTILPANNSRLADQKLGATVFQEIQVLRFLGNTEAVNRHEAVLQYITGRGNATRAEIETFYRNNIRALVSQVVDEQLARLRNRQLINNPSANALTDVKSAITEFMLAPSEATYRNLLLTSRRNAGDGALVLGFAMEEFNGEVRGAIIDNRILTGR